MTESEQVTVTPAAAPARTVRVGLIIGKAVALTALTVLLAVLQGWVAPRFYKPDYKAGFHMGLLQGALMPAALPGLLTGHDLPIYAPNNSGQSYKIGYILGINTCGTLFFGVAFWGMGGRKRKVEGR
jgi:hypothetical protein